MDQRFLSVRIDSYRAVPAFRGEQEGRKPAPGMLLRLPSEGLIYAVSSLMTGDRPRDIAVAQAANIPARLVPSDSCKLTVVVIDRLRHTSEDTAA